MPAELVRDLNLESHGLILERPGHADHRPWSGHCAPSSCVPARSGRRRLCGLPRADGALRKGAGAAVLAGCRRDWGPPTGPTGWALLGLGWQIRKLGRRDMRELLRIGGMNVHDLLEEQFQSDAL